MHISEEDIRTKIVYNWLKDCGITEDCIYLERSFEVQLGKGTKTLRPRADLLITNSQGQNLLIIEVKEPNHKLDNDDKFQALSYARLLKNGIAPFTILTNGKESKIFDSITGEILTCPIASHPYTLNNFYPSGEGIDAKFEAIKHLVTLSSENLLSICSGQVDYHMKLLRSKELFDGKKYVPQLYVHRNESFLELNSRIYGNNKIEKRNVVLVVGPPQHGKTSFICNYAETLIANNHPCLFYTAVSLKNGLIAEVKSDLNWLTKSSREDVHWLEHLNRLALKANKNFIIIVDGWNEMAEDAFVINDDCNKLNLTGIQIIISATSFSLNSLLKDSCDNLGYIGSEVQVSSYQINHLRQKALIDTEKLSIVQVGKFNTDEITEASLKYSKEYNVEIGEHSLLSDPFYLRLASEEFANGKIPNQITALRLIKNSLKAKAKRQNIDEISLFKALKIFGKLVIKHGRSFPISKLPDYYSSERDFKPWIDSALMVLYTTDYDILIDFYYTHDLDYTIAIICKQWHIFFNEATDIQIKEELVSCLKPEATYSALTWFLSTEEHIDILKKLFSFVDVTDTGFNEFLHLLIKALFNISSLGNEYDQKWLADFILKNKSAFLSDEHDEEYALPALISIFLKTIDREKDEEQYCFWMSMLVKYDSTVEEVGIDESYISAYYGDDIRSYDGFQESTPLDVDLFFELIQSEDTELAKKAMYILSYACPYYILEDFRNIYNSLKSNPSALDVLNVGIEQAYDNLHENYFGSMCKGWLIDSEPAEEFTNEYKSQLIVLTPIIKLLKEYPVAQDLKDVLIELRKLAILDDDMKEEVKEIVFFDPNQLTLDL